MKIIKELVKKGPNEVCDTQIKTLLEYASKTDQCFIISFILLLSQF